MKGRKQNGFQVHARRRTPPFGASESNGRGFGVNSIGRPAVTLAAALLALAAGVSVASADEANDRKVYPGSMCVPKSEYNDGVRYDLLGANNSGLRDEWFTCPVINDGIKAGWSVALVQVRGADVECFGSAIPWGGWRVFVTPRKTSSSDSLSTLSLGSTFLESTDLGMTDNPLNSVFAHYEINCLLPPSTSITRYYIRE